MGKEEPEEIEEEIRSYLGLNHRLVGIKISEENVDGNHPTVSMTFCRTVREALAGKELVMRIDDLDCPNAELCLGFREPTYVDVEPRIKTTTKAVRVGPLEDADVVLLVLNSEQVMIMSILLGGIRAEFKGEMAICGEAVAKVCNEGEPNVSFLCSGARELGGFETREVVLSLPYALLLELPDRMTKFASLSRSPKVKVDQELNLKGEVCPYTFVKTKLALEMMETDQVLRVIVDHLPAVENVPRSVANEGHEVLNVGQVNDTDWEIVIRKAG